jgi:D,D-heptose 1,7-bisphosphate phosphatase
MKRSLPGSASRTAGGAAPDSGADLPGNGRAVFLDRDGVLMEDRGYVHRIEDVALLPGVGTALRRLQDAGFGLFVVTNQSGIGRGYYRVEDVQRVNEHLAGELARAGVHVIRVYVAPEAPEQPSRGRKPSPQFLFDARDEFGLDLAHSYMIGDKRSDLECGWRAGVKCSLLVRTGYGAQTESDLGNRLGPLRVFADLPAAVEWILGDRVRDRGLQRT